MKELTVLMPCLNEAETIGACIKRARQLLDQNGIDGEVLICDNGSTDSSREIALAHGARVIQCPVRGYGAALMFGIENALGEYILMGDSDDSYHFDEAMPMMERLRAGYDICMGTRLKGRIMPGAMPRLNRYLGNPLLTAVGKVFFKIGVSDFHCGMRAFRRDRVLKLQLVTEGMEWASEMIIKSKLAGLSMTEVPITLYKDGRDRMPHLRRWRDGWRHLRFMLLHSPKWLFFIPGLILTCAGLTGEVLLALGQLRIGAVTLDVHSLIVMAFILIAGAQILFTGTFAKIYAHLSGILPYDERFDIAIKRLTLEKLLCVSLAFGILGMSGFLYAFWKWSLAGFPHLDYRVSMRLLVPSLTLAALSVQGIFNGFMLSVLFFKTKKA